MSVTTKKILIFNVIHGTDGRLRDGHRVNAVSGTTSIMECPHEASYTSYADYQQIAAATAMAMCVDTADSVVDGLLS